MSNILRPACLVSFFVLRTELYAPIPIESTDEPFCCQDGLITVLVGWLLKMKTLRGCLSNIITCPLSSNDYDGPFAPWGLQEQRIFFIKLEWDMIFFFCFFVFIHCSIRALL